MYETQTLEPPEKRSLVRNFTIDDKLLKDDALTGFTETVSREDIMREAQRIYTNVPQSNPRTYRDLNAE